VSNVPEFEYRHSMCEREDMRDELTMVIASPFRSALAYDRSARS